MVQTCRGTFAWPHSRAILPWALALSFAVLQSAQAADAPERERLTALARQIDLTDRLAELAAATASPKSTRYHFDYERLRADLRRVRTGLQDYLVPQRAQPHDPLPLTGDYTRSNASQDKKAPSP